MNVYKNEFVGCHSHQQKFDSLKSIREKVNWDIEEERHVFLCQLNFLFSDWKCQYHAEEIDWFLTESITFRDEAGRNCSGELIIKFLVNSGYKDQPKKDQDGKPLERRTTAVHRVARSGFLNKDIMIRELFKIYNNFDVNYTDSSGLTHFHLACAIGCDDVVEKFLELGQDPNLLMHEIGYSALHLALAYDRRKVAQLLLRCNADPNLANPEGSTALHLICKMDSPNALMKVLFETSDKKSQPLPLDAQDKEGKTALHLALKNGHKEVVQLLLERDADPNLTDKEGATALHITCQTANNDLAEMIFEISDEKHRHVLVDAQNKKGNTPLHVALYHHETEVARLLLRKGANPTLANKKGQIPLHMVSGLFNEDESLRMLFALGNDQYHPVPLNAKDKRGKTPLHLALHYNNKKEAEWLLRRGAHPHLTDDFGNQALHVMSKVSHNKNLVKTFFKVSDELNQQLQIDARNSRGKTPLYLALKQGNKKMIELLLRRGSDPKLAKDRDESTPLHLICKSGCDNDSTKIFLKIMNEDRHETVPIDARDKYGRTPLQYAVATLLPKTVDVLLDHGADLSNFVFPSESLFDFGVKFNDVTSIKITSGILAVVERLETRGYELSRRNALTIMKLFAKYKLFVKSTDLEVLDRHDHEKVTREAKKTMISPSLSLYDLIQLRPEQVAKRITFMECFEFALKIKWWKRSGERLKSCFAQLSEKLARGFFRGWSLYPFWDVIHNRLPLECCGMILDNLTNEDLYHIFVAANEQSS